MTRHPACGQAVAMDTGQGRLASASVEEPTPHVLHALAHEVFEWQAAVAIAARNDHDEAQVGLRQGLDRLRITPGHPLGQRDVLLGQSRGVRPISRRYAPTAVGTAVPLSAAAASPASSDAVPAQRHGSQASQARAGAAGLNGTASVSVSSGSPLHTAARAGET